MSFFQRVRVPAGFAFAGFFLYLAQPRPACVFPGLAVACLGLGLRMWAAGYLEKGRALAMSGPYLRTRNPLYLGSFLMGLGFTIAGSRLDLVLSFLILFSCIYLPVMRKEEKELQQAFGVTYRLYRESVPLFLPRLTHKASLQPLQSNFCWQRVILNREYKAVMGFVVAAGFVLLRMP